MSSLFDYIFGSGDSDTGVDLNVDSNVDSDASLGPTPTYGQSSSYADAMESIALTFGGFGSATMPSYLSNNEEFSKYFTSIGGAAPKTADASPSNTAETKSSDSLLNKVSGFVEKNKGLTEMVLKGIGGATAASQARKLAEQNSRSRIGELQEADRIKQAENARISASVSGLRPPGIVRRQMPLRRIDGTNVFNNGKIGG